MWGRNFLKRKISPPHPLFKELNWGDLLNAECGIDEDFAVGRGLAPAVFFVIN